MAQFTATEQRLLEHITADRLRSSLTLIRQASEDIWSFDAPHIIQDYTDHGIKHSERISDFVSKLLQVNYGHPFSSEEMYLLLAGVYLHDIGMQCDVAMFPQIKHRAQELGANFDIEFTAQTANTYSTNEQKAIRKNHQFLSAAWIAYAFNTGETVLGLAAQTIPNQLVSDLMDVCLYHTKLSINNCPLNLKLDPTGRKQLVAALLRFADELDIDANRVSIETVKNFSLDPQNAVFWWLHNYTRIIFNANIITITIILHPEDFKQYGPFVYDAFINQFQTKNRPVLTILRQHNIPLAINAESEVIEYGYAERLPSTILQALNIMNAKREPPLALADEVRSWLQTIRYEVTEPQKQEMQTVKMIATMEHAMLLQKVLIHCIDGEITHAHVETLDKLLDRNTPQGWLISDTRVSPQAREYVAQNNALRVFNMSDFLRQMVWGPYFDTITSLVERDKIHELYIDFACYKLEVDERGQEISRQRYASLDIYIDTWAIERGKAHISLLGEFGAGKTWFCRHYSYRQLKRYLDDPFNERLPLLITLHSFTKALTPQQLINDALLEQYKLVFVGSAFEIFQEMNRQGKLLLILDGFDEMARQVNYETIANNFWELAKLVDENSKVILTSRTEYFRWAIESERILGGKETGKQITPLPGPRFEVVYLDEFDSSQIRQVIIKRLGNKTGPAMADYVLSRQNLADLARKPVLIELLLVALDEAKADQLRNPAYVYLYATNKLLLRNITTQRTFTTTSDKLYFLCELAWEMLKGDRWRFYYEDFPTQIQNYFIDKIKDSHELDLWDFDLRNQTLLHRNSAGYYEFAHKSLAEYFIAFKFAAELGCLDLAFKQTYQEASEEPSKIPVETKSVVLLAKTFGMWALTNQRMQAIHSLLLDMMPKDATNRLWEIINESKNKTPQEVGYIASNAVTLLLDKSESFKGAKLGGTILTGVRFVGADLSNADLQGAYLTDADLTNCVLKQSDFRNTDLTDAKLGHFESFEQLSWSPDGKFCACSRPGDGLRLWETQNWGLVTKIFSSELSYSFRVNWSFDSKYLVCVDGSSKVLIWNASENSWASEESSHWGIILSATFTPKGQLLVASWNHPIAKLWIPGYTEPLLNIKYYDAIGHIVFCPKGTHFVIVPYTGVHIKIFDSEFNILGAWSQGKVRGHVKNVAFSPDGNLLAIAFSRLQRNIVVLLNGRTGEFISELDIDATCIHFTTDERLYLITANGYIQILDAKSLIELEVVAIGSNYLSSLSESSQYLATANDYTSVGIWDIDIDSSTYGKCIKVLKTVEANFQGMQISGARGLKTTLFWGTEQEESLLKFLADRGAILDDEQKLFVEQEQLRHKHNKVVSLP